MMMRGRSVNSLILLIFFVSGFLALAYQVLWSKFLLNFIGVSAYSYAVVLASFMCGLGLGSRFLGPWGDRVRSPLKFYAYLELGIGLYAVLYLPLCRGASDLYSSWVSFGSYEAGASAGLWAKVVLSGFLLLPPTILMGGTYPVLLRQVAELPELIGKRASQLYAVNSLGAVFGALSMSFILLPALGLTASLMLLACCNVIIALLAFFLSAVPSAQPAGSVQNPQHSVETVGAASNSHQPQLALFLIFLEGCLAFALEIGWTRYFGVVLGSSTYSFSVMLAAFISGIALGSWWLGKIDHRIQNPLSFFGWTQVLAGLLILLPLPLYPYVPWLFGKYSSFLSQDPAAFYLYEIGKLFLCYCIMLPPTIFIGMALPLVVKGLSRDLAQLGSKSGRVYSFNTWGNVTGALLGGLLLLPWLGMESLLRWSAAASVLSGLAAFWIYSQKSTLRRTKREIYTTVAALCLLLLSVSFFGSWNRLGFTFLPFRRSQSVPPFSSLTRNPEHVQILLFKDDPAAHIIVKKTPPSGRVAEQISLYTNGKVDASSGKDMITQLLIGHVPVLFHPSPKNVLVIGYASGITTGAVLKHPVESVDVVEIVRGMSDASRYFRRWNGTPEQDRRFHLIVDDARNYLSHTRQKYDVIVSEPSNPWTAGTSGLFTSDFYEGSTRALQPNGIYLQWIQTYSLSDKALGSIFRSFRSVYPYVYVFQGAAGDLLLLGSLHPLHPDWQALERRLTRPEVSNDLKSISVRDLSTLLYFQVLSPVSTDYVAAMDDLENTDDNNFLEYRAPRDLFERSRPTMIASLDERLFSSPSLFYSQYVRDRSHAIPSRFVIDMLWDERVRVPEISDPYALAYSYLSSPQLPPADNQAIPQVPVNSAIYNWRETELLDRLNALLKQKRFHAANSILQAVASTFLLESVHSSEKSEIWKRHIQTWLDSDTDSQQKLRIRFLLLHLLMASGEEKEAAKVLVQLLNEHSSIPASILTLRAFQIDPQRFGPDVLKFCLSREKSPFLERYARLALQK